MGPLEGMRIIEIAGIGPGPYCAMLLADMGAEVVRLVRPGPDPFATNPSLDLLSRSRRSLCVDLKTTEGVDTVLRMLGRADGLFEGFRPGVMERLGLGPEVCLERNPTTSTTSRSRASSPTSAGVTSRRRRPSTSSATSAAEV
jgi:alpha-methylacyl-CoA racemase